jgi:hypothetical protein
MSGSKRRSIRSRRAWKGTMEEASLDASGGPGGHRRDPRAHYTTDSGIGYGMEQTLDSLREAAEALRVLGSRWNANPDMLIRGASPQGGRGRHQRSPSTFGRGGALYIVVPGIAIGSPGPLS